MKRKLTSILLSLTILFTSTFLTGCFGSFKAFNNLRNWNSNVTDNKWANELIFLVLWIVPVYGLFVLGDLLIFNTVEFWSGDNPLAMEEGEMQEQNITYNGKEYKMRATKNKLELFDAQGILVSTLDYDPEDLSWYVTENGKTKKAMSVTDMNPQTTDVKFYDANCDEGLLYSVSNRDLKAGTQIAVW